MSAKDSRIKNQLHFTSGSHLITYYFYCTYILKTGMDSNEVAKVK